jgi:hypothetical protein
MCRRGGRSSLAGRREKAQMWLVKWWGQLESCWLGTKPVTPSCGRYLTFGPATPMQVASWRFPAARNELSAFVAAAASLCVRQSKKRALHCAIVHSGPATGKLSRITC